MVSESEAMTPSAAAPQPVSRRWALGLLLAPALVGGWLWLKPSDEIDLRGVRLGLSAADTRARFAAPGPGEWASEANPEPALRWTAADPSGPVREAIFEFHQGMLVAIRLQLPAGSPEARGARLEATAGRLVARSPQGDGVRLVVLSRTCPAHAAEVARLLRGGGSGAE